MRFHSLILFAISIMMAFSCQPKKKEADLIIHNATVYTVDSAFAIVSSFAVKDGRIVARGTDEQIMGNYMGKQVVDAQRKFVYPAFMDAHGHFVIYGQSLFEVDLTGSKSFEEVIERVEKFYKSNPDSKIIKGRGWDQNLFPDKKFPNNEILNSKFPDVPVILHRIDVHALVANQKALSVAAIKPNQKIKGGEIETKNGRLTGILIDNAVSILMNALPKPTRSEYVEWLQAAQQKCFENGLTSVTDCGLLDYTDVLRIDSIQKNNQLQIRLQVMLTDKKINYDYFLDRGTYQTDRLRVSGFKVFGDGALGSRGACLLNDYKDKAGWKGFLLNSPEHFDSVAAQLINTNFQMCTHAIGDSTNRVLLKIYNKYLNGKNDKRWRIEHAQIVNDDDMNLFGASSVIPCVQPTSAISDMPWAADRMGGELKGAYATRQLLYQNGWIPLSTDFPVESVNPIKTFSSAIFRKDDNGEPAAGFLPQQALTREEALRGVTLWAAKAAFMEAEIGSIEVGKQADFIIMDKDIMSASQSELVNQKVEVTYLAGSIVYQKKIKKLL